jgi:hypothetical protein
MSEFGDIKVFKNREDFTLENRHLICIANKEYINKNLIVLFYKKSDKKENPIYEIFSKVGNSLKILNLNFIICAVDQIPGLDKTFQEIVNDPDHPYHWIRNRPKFESKDMDTGSFKFPFILIYRKGFPQGFYEGAVEEREFRDFCVQTTVKNDFVNNFPSDSKELVKQQWMEYRYKPKEEVKGKPVFDSFNMIDYADKTLLTSSFQPFSPKRQ